MELLKIQVYPIIFCRGCARHLDDIIILSSIDPEMYVWFHLEVFKASMPRILLLQKSLPLLHEHDGYGILLHLA
jgi:hypothetical protein